MFANGPRAIGICDQCGFQFLRHELHYAVTDTDKRTKKLVCNECNDPPHPQGNPRNFLMGPEAISIKDPRPDPAIDDVRNLFGTNPVQGIELRTFPRYIP